MAFKDKSIRGKKKAFFKEDLYLSDEDIRETYKVKCNTVLSITAYIAFGAKGPVTDKQLKRIRTILNEKKTP